MQNIVPLPAFDDNYIWLLHGRDAAVVVDPGNALPVMRFCEQHGLALAAILITHHHADHTDGIAALTQRYHCPVYGPDNPAICGITHRLTAGMNVRVAELNLQLSVLAVPGHTSDHIAYFGDGNLFCGDTLFACGCGRVFDSSPWQLHHSLQQLAALPENTKIFCAHEYTLSNQRFALAVEPDNQALQQRNQADSALRKNAQPTLPSTLAAELECNPFLRCHLPAIKAAVEAHCGKKLTNEEAVFTEMRAWKNTFR